MTMARVGLPGGLTYQTWQLEELPWTQWRRRVQEWLGEIWQEKDELIQQTLDSRESQ